MKKIFAIALSFAVSACSSTSSNSSNVQLPSWYKNPVYKDGIASAECTKFNGNLSISKKKAQVYALVSLASQISANIESVTGITTTLSNEVNNTSMKAIDHVHVKQMIAGAKIIDFEQGSIDGEKQFCVLIGISESFYMNAVKRNTLDTKTQNALIQGYELSRAKQQAGG
jgi:hypothetical protein